MLGPANVIWDQIPKIWPQEGQPGNPGHSRQNTTVLDKVNCRGTQS